MKTRLETLAKVANKVGLVNVFDYIYNLYSNRTSKELVSFISNLSMKEQIETAIEFYDRSRMSRFNEITRESYHLMAKEILLSVKERKLRKI